MNLFLIHKLILELVLLISLYIQYEKKVLHGVKIGIFGLFTSFPNNRWKYLTKQQIEATFLKAFQCLHDEKMHFYHGKIATQQKAVQISAHLVSHTQI